MWWQWSWWNVPGCVCVITVLPHWHLFTIYLENLLYRTSQIMCYLNFPLVARWILKGVVRKILISKWSSEQNLGMYASYGGSKRYKVQKVLEARQVARQKGSNPVYFIQPEKKKIQKYMPVTQGSFHILFLIIFGPMNWEVKSKFIISRSSILEEITKAESSKKVL